MSNEFRKYSKDNETRYVLESASGGSSSAGAIASVSKDMNLIQSRDMETETMMPSNTFAGSKKNKLGTAGQLKGSIKRPAHRGDLVGGDAQQEGKAVKTTPTTAPRNYVAKNAAGRSGAGAHIDKKRAAKQGDTKHKKPVELSEGMNDLKDLQAEVYELYKDVHGSRPRHWSSEQFNDQAFLQQQRKTLLNMVSNMSPEEKAEQDWSDTDQSPRTKLIHDVHN